MTDHVADSSRKTGPPGDDQPDPRRWRILAVSLVVGFMSLLDVSIVNVAIPTMQEGLGTSASSIQWVVSGYALTFGLTLVAGGRLGDAYGRGRMMLIGLAGFVLASAAVGLAPNATLVIVARLAQGAAAGLLTPQNSGIIQVLFHGEERGRAFGIFGLTVSLASATGPVIGGLIIQVAGEENGWRWLFLINVPIGLVAALAVLRLVPARVRSDSDDDPRIDVPGAVLLGLTVLCLLYPIVSLESGARLPLLLLLGVPAFAWAFVRWERRTVRRGASSAARPAPAAPAARVPNGLAVGTLYFTGFTGLLLVLSVYLQDGLDYTAAADRSDPGPFAAGSAISSPLAGRFVTRVGRRLTVGALVVTMPGVLLVVLVAPGREPLWRGSRRCCCSRGSAVVRWSRRTSR